MAYGTHILVIESSGRTSHSLTRLGGLRVPLDLDVEKRTIRVFEPSLCHTFARALTFLNEGWTGGALTASAGCNSTLQDEQKVY